MSGRARAPTPQFAGIELQLPSPEARARARRNTKKHWDGRRLAAKLDELLGSVDEDEKEQAKR